MVGCRPKPQLRALVPDTRRQRRYLRYAWHRCGSGLRLNVLSRSPTIPSIAVWSALSSRNKLRADSRLQQGQQSQGWLACQCARVRRAAEQSESYQEEQNSHGTSPCALFLDVVRKRAVTAIGRTTETRVGHRRVPHCPQCWARTGTDADALGAACA